MSKKIFIITGEESGDKIASLVINKLQEKYYLNQYLAVGGKNIQFQKISCIFDIKEIAFIGLIDVLKNLSAINKKINFTVKKILEFNPDVIFSVDAPDFSFRVLKKVKKNIKNIKTLHLVAPQVWAWRENRKKFLHQYIDHLLLLFHFEKKYFDGFIKNSFVGHPFLDSSVFKLSKPKTVVKKYITLCPGTRISEIKMFMPIFIELIKKINLNYNFIFHIPMTLGNSDIVKNYFQISQLDNYLITNNEVDKNFYIQNSLLSISKSGTITLDICKNQCPLIVIYKTSWLNYFLIKPFINTKFGNILNIIANEEIIPELIQEKCNTFEIYKKAMQFINNERLGDDLVAKYTKILEKVIVPNSLDKICDYLME